MTKEEYRQRIVERIDYCVSIIADAKNDLKKEKEELNKSKLEMHVLWHYMQRLHEKKLWIAKHEAYHEMCEQLLKEFDQIEL